MRIRLLGTAAGGGLPQWNCRCRICGLARVGRVKRRAQSCVAVSAVAGRWVLVNASPDFAAQVETLHVPNHASAERSNPVDAVLLTNADLDHVLGLLNMREAPTLEIHATTAVQRTLAEALSLGTLLDSFSRVQWHEAVENFAPFPVADGTASTVEFRAIPLPGGPPPFARLMPNMPTGHCVAYEFHDRDTDKRLLVAPDVAETTPELLAALQRADAVLFDGTFWDDDELQRIKSGARTARAMGHLPIRDGSLALLRSLPAARKSYLHINNTNPILDPASPERAEVAAAGIRVEEDGTEWIL